MIELQETKYTASGVAAHHSLFFINKLKGIKFSKQ